MASGFAGEFIVRDLGCTGTWHVANRLGYFGDIRGLGDMYRRYLDLYTYKLLSLLEESYLKVVICDDAYTDNI